MSWWNTYDGGDATEDGKISPLTLRGVNGDEPWDYADAMVSAYWQKFHRNPKLSEVKDAFELFLENNGGWCPEDRPVELVDVNGPEGRDE